MNISDFFEFSSKLSMSTIQAQAIDLKKDKKGLNNQWNLIKGEYSEINFPVIFKQSKGKNFMDVLDTGWPGLFLMSDKMVDALSKNKLTGWKTFIIKLYDKSGNEIFGYQGFSVTGRCGPTKYEKAEIIEKRLVPTGPICKFYRGRYVGLDQWDGSDFFIPKKSYGIIVTKKAFDVIKNNKFSNIRLTNLADIEIDIDDVLKIQESMLTKP